MAPKSVALSPTFYTRLTHDILTELMVATFYRGCRNGDES